MTAGISQATWVRGVKGGMKREKGEMKREKGEMKREKGGCPDLLASLTIRSMRWKSMRRNLETGGRRYRSMTNSRLTRRKVWLWLIQVRAFTICWYRGSLMPNLYHSQAR